jgi:HAD superfamily 5'-nucleotidase-like hydrolase
MHFLENTQWLGFDMDHTLVRYNNEELYKLVFHCFQKYLVEIAGFDRSVYEIPLKMEYTRKGLVLDEHLGNMLELDTSFRVIHACHGYHVLTDEEIQRAYGQKTIVPFGEDKEHYWCLVTYFEASVGPLYVGLVDMIDRLHPTNMEEMYKKLGESLAGSFAHNFRDFESGWYFPVFKESVGTFIQKSPEMSAWLRENRKSGTVRTFLLTNSFPQYTQLLMSYAYGDDWMDLFDIVGTTARKPVFYEDARVDELVADYAFRINPHGEVCIVDEHPKIIALNGCYDKPSYAGMSAAFGCKPEQVTYCGDHLWGDVVHCGAAGGWETIYVMEELESSHHEEMLGPFGQCPMLGNWQVVEVNSPTVNLTPTPEAVVGRELRVSGRFLCEMLRKKAPQFAIPHMERFPSILPHHVQSNEQLGRYVLPLSES